MTIKKGQPWGELADVPQRAVRVNSDGEARSALEAARREKRPFPPLELTGGDLCRTLGGTGLERLEDGRRVRFTVDVGEVLIEGRLRLFVAHLVARNPLWTRAFVAMNAQWLGRWNLGPRAHPNDGLLDTYDARLAVGQVLVVRARLHHGTHLPHPGIREQRTRSVTVEVKRPLTVRLDGQPVGRTGQLVVRAEPDALVVFA